MLHRDTVWPQDAASGYRSGPWMLHHDSGQDPGCCIVIQVRTLDAASEYRSGPWMLHRDTGLDPGCCIVIQVRPLDAAS